MKKILLGILSLFFLGSVFAQDTVTFNVDMSADTTFNPTTQNVYISGSFAGWAEPGSDTTLQLAPSLTDSMNYTLTITGIAEGEIQYKYFLVESTPDWNNGEWPGGLNRVAVITGKTILNNTWANKPFQVTFNVDMSVDTTFDTVHDQVFIAGDLANGWAQPGTIPYYEMNRSSADTFSISLIMYKGNYNYKYFIVIDSVPSWDNGEWSSTINRTVAVDTTMTVNNTWGIITGIPVNKELPSFSYYPNPVQNTLFINNLEHVNRIDIFNLIGQKVRTINTITSTKISIQTGDLNNGVYIISVVGNNGLVKSMRFIKR